MSEHSALRIPISHRFSGSFPNTSFAVPSILSSLFDPPIAAFDESCIKSRFYQFSFAELEKYVIYAFGLSPNTIGELINGT